MQKIFSLDTYLGPFLMRYLGKYVKLRDDQFVLSLWGGDAVLNHVELQYDIFEHLIPLPIGFKSGQVHELRIHIPWTRLSSSSIVITLNTVECILALKKPEESRSKNQGPPPSSTSSPSAIQDDLPPGYLQSYLNRILCNIQVVVNNLIVKFVEDTIVLSLNVRSLDCFPTSSNWTHGIPSLTANQNFCLYRLLKLTDLTLCMDESDAKGHIATYQDPIVYRCNLDVRIQTFYSQKSYCFNNGLASLCIANLLCSNLECNISQTQLPLIARLLEILLALAYGALDWNALSTGWEKNSSQESSNILTDELEERTTKTVAGSDDPQQSWSSWAWSFVPSILQVGSSPSFDESSDEEVESEFADYASSEGFQSNNGAEFLRLICDSALEGEAYPTEATHTTNDGALPSTTQPAGFSPSHVRENLQQKQRKFRRWRIRQLRAYQHKTPTLVLGALVQKVTLNIKVDEPLNTPPRAPATDMSSSSAFRSSTSRRRCAHILAFQVEAENMGINCVQHGEEFSSVQMAVDSISAISCGGVCACGSPVGGGLSRTTSSHTFTLSEDHKEGGHCQKVIYLSPVRRSDHKNSTTDLFSCLFADSPPGLVRSATTPQLPQVGHKLPASVSNDSVIDGLLSRQSPLPPMTRAAYIGTFDEEFFKCGRPALWMDVVTSRERPHPQPTDEWTEAVMKYNKYTFSRLLAGNLTVNFTLPASHRIQQLFSLVSTGSGKFKPCFDYGRLLVLPPQSPVDSWILHDRIAQLNAFLPIQVSRVELSSLTLNIHPPTHNFSILSDLACIRLRTGPLLMLSCEPADPVHMVSTMTHLQPSTGVLEALASTLEGVADQPLLASEDFWGRHSQWVGCYGDPHSQPVPTATAAAEAAEIDDVLATATISGITRSLQMRLLNACYTRRLYSLSEVRLEFLPPNHNCRTLISVLEVKLFQRDLFYPTSWPEQLGHGLVTRESIAQISPEIRLQLSSMDLCQVVLFISSLTAEDHSFAASWNNHPFSSQPFSEVALRRLFDPPSEDASSAPSADLLITMKGKSAIQSRLTPAGGLFSLCLRTPEVSGALLFATSLLPIFERRSFSVVSQPQAKDRSGAALREVPFLSLRYETARPSAGQSRPLSVVCSFESLDVLISKALLDWVGRSQDSLLDLLRVCEADKSQAPVPPSSTAHDIPPPPSSAELGLVIGPGSHITPSGASQESFSVISSHQPLKSLSTEPGDRLSTSGPLPSAPVPSVTASKTAADTDFFTGVSKQLANSLSWLSACQLDIQLQSSSILFCPSEFPPALHPSPSRSFPTRLLRVCLSKSPPPATLLELTLPQLRLRGPSAGRSASSEVISPVKSPRSPSGASFVFQENDLLRSSSPPPPPVQSPSTPIPASFTWSLQALRAGVSVAGTRLAAGNLSVTMSVSQDDVKEEAGAVPSQPSPLVCNIFCNATNLASTGGEEDERKLFYCVAAQREGDMSAEHLRNLLLTAFLIFSEFEAILSKVSIVSTTLRRTFTVRQPLCPWIAKTDTSKMVFSSPTSLHQQRQCVLGSDRVDRLKLAPSSAVNNQPDDLPVPTLSVLFQFTLSSIIGRICLQPLEAGNAVSWDLEGLNLTVNRTDSMILFLSRIDRFAVLLRTKEGVFPLVTPGEHYLKTFMDITPCPGSRPQGNQDGAADGFCPTPLALSGPAAHITASASTGLVGEQEAAATAAAAAAQTPLSADERPGALTLAFLHTRVDQVRAAFQGKRFSDWLDRPSELFLLGKAPTSSPPVAVETGGSSDVGLPFINSIYAHLAPLDLVLCPDLVSACALFSTQVLEELHSPLKKSSSPVRTAFPVATWPGHCMPLLFFILDRFRLFVPCSSIDCWTAKTATKGKEALVLTCNSVRLHPFPVNLISRPVVPISHQQRRQQHHRHRGRGSCEGSGAKHFLSIVSETELGAGLGDLGTAREDRQYVLHARGLGASLVDLSQATFAGRDHGGGTAMDYRGLSSVADYSSPLVGQCPALDWNRAAAKAEIAKASVWVLPVLRPLSLTLSFAAPICDSTLYLGRPRVVAGCGLEMNLDSDFVCTLFVPLIGQWLAGLTNLVANRAVSTPGPAPPPQPRTLVEATPTRLLLTGGLVRFVAWIELANSASSPAVCLLVADFIQPHLLWRRNTPWLDSTQAAALEFGLNNLQLYSRVVEHDWCSQRWRHSVRWHITQPASTRVTPPFCLPRSLPLPLVASPLQAASAPFDQKPPLHERAFLSSSASTSTVDGGLLRVRLLRSHQPAVHVTTQPTRHPTTVASFKLDACVQRDLLITFTPTSVGALTSLIDSFVINMPALPSHKETKNPTTDIQKTASFHQGPSTPVDSCSVKTTRIKLLLVGDDAGCALPSALSLSAESFCLDGAFDGSAHWSSASHTATLKWLDISWDRPASPPSPNSAFRFLSSPSSVHCVLSTSSEPACSSTSRLFKVHLTPGPRLMFPVGGTVLQDLQALLRAYAEPAIRGPRRPPARKLSAGRSTPKAQVFYDDLRTNPLFQFSAVAESASSDRLPLPYEVVFCTLTEPRECIAMVWAYPLPRQPVRLQLSPIPIACRDEALLDTSDIELSCELQYLDEDSGDFLTYREFSICESRATEVPLPGLAAVSHESCPSDLLSSQQQLQHQGALEVTAMATPEGNFCWGGGLDRRTMDGLTEFRKRMDTDWSSGCSGRAEGGHSPKYLSTGHTVAFESTTPKSARVWRVLVNCFGRRVSKQSKETGPEDPEAQTPVLLSPSVLATCTQIDMAFVPQLQPSLGIRLSTDYARLSLVQVSTSDCPASPVLTPSDAFCSVDFELAQMELTGLSLALRFTSSSTNSSSPSSNTPFVACSARSIVTWLFTPHWTHLQRLFKVTKIGLLYAPSFTGVPHGSLWSCASETCRLEFSNELLFALGWLTNRLKEFQKSTANDCPGWVIRNNTDKEIVVEQCLPRHKMGPLTDETSSAQTVVCLQSLQNIHRLHLTPGECHVWRPSHLSFPSDLTGPMSRQQISLRIGLIDSWGCSKTTSTCHWSYPLHLVWPPATRKASAPDDGISAMVEVAWPSELGGPASAARGLHPMSQLSLLLMQSPASGLPGELVIQAGLLLHNLLPHSLHFRLGWRAQRGGFSNEGVVPPRSRLAIYLPTTVPPQPLNNAEQSARMKFIISLSASEGWTPFSLAIPTAPASSDSPEDTARFVKRRLIQLSLPDGSYNASFPILFTSRLCHIGEMAHPLLVLSFSSPLTITNHLPLPLTLTSCSPKEMSFVRATSEDAVQTPSFSSSNVFSVKAASEGVPVLASGVEDFHFTINYDNGDPVFAAPFRLQLSELLERLFQLISCTTPSGSDNYLHSELSSRLASRVMLGLSPISPPPIRTGLAEEGFELVILPWLLLRNRSGLDLWIYTSAGGQKEDARCHLHRLAAGTSYMPPSGQRLFRLGLSGDDGREAVSWSSSMLLVHKSAFAAAVSAATTGRAAGPRAYLTASESPQSNTTMAGPKDSAASVNPLLPSRPSLVVTIPMSNNRVCCLSVELRVVDLSVPANGPGGCPQSLPPPPSPQVQVVISPHVRFVNRSGCPLLLKLLALRFEPTQPPVPLEKFDDHPLSLPGSSSFTSSSASTSSASTVDGYFWKSCSRSERPPKPSGPLDLRYFMAIRAPSSKWWSQCLELSLCRTATITPEDDENTSTTATVRVGCTHPGPHSQSCVALQYRHFSFMLSDTDGGSEELSILVSMYRGEHSVFTELVFDRLPDPMRQCLACCLHNLTSEPFQVALEPTSETPPPLSGHLPTLAPNGGQLVLLPQSELDCFCQPSSTDPSQDAGHVHGSCSFLAQGNVALRFQSASNTQTFHLDLAELLTTNGTAVLQPATTASPAICAKVKRDNSSTAPFHVIIIISAQDDPDQPEPASLVAPSYPYPCSSYFLHIDHLTIPICSAVSFGSGDCGAAMGVAQRPDEFMRLSVSCLQAAIMLDYRDDNCALTDFHLSSSFLQLDNRAHGWTNLFDFPVLLRSALTPASQAVTSTGSLFCLRGRSTDLGVQWIEAELPHLEVFLEDSAVSAVIRWAQDLHMALANVPGWGKDAASRPQPSSPTLMYLRHLRIAPLSLQVALQAAVGVHLSCKSTRLCLAPFQLLTGAGRNSGVVITPACLLGQLGVHYISQAIFRAGWLLGGLELIGNPAGLVSAFADGVWDLVHFTDTTSPPSLQQAQRIDREERLSLLRGFASGLTSLTKHATGGVISSVTGLAANFARNMHALSLDSEHVQRVTLSRQRTGEPNSLFHGLRLGLSEFGVSLLGGLAGIAHHPLRAVMPSIDEPSSPPPPPVLATHRPPPSPQRSALPPTDTATAVGAISRLAGALVTGLGRGLVGVVAKPLAGAADLVAMTGAGFMHGMGVGWGVNLTPRHLTGPLETGLDLPPVDTLLLSRWAHALLTQSSAQCIWSGLARSGTGERIWLALLSLLPPASSILYIVRFGDSTRAPLPLLLCVAPIDISTSADTSAPAQVAVSRAIELLLGPSELLFNGDDKAALLCAVERWASYSHCQMSRQDDEQESEKLERVRAYLSSLPD